MPLPAEAGRAAGNPANPAERMNQPGFFRRRMVDPILALLKQGITPEKIASSIAWGVALSSMPVLGTGTITCTIAALTMRLNLPAIQLANWLAYPIQLALLLPFFRMGELLFRAEHVPLTPSQLIGMFKVDFWGSLRALGDTVWHGVTAWALVAAVFIPLCYFMLTPVLRKIPFKSRA